ncbi:MAG: carbamoyltransferase HypF [Verrucomicrobiales bacterium]|nr:carbamoyltransferase HypF [Verrucomicrobiales bacterium]
MGTASPTARLRLIAHGTVQGVGFRPFVYRLATELGLSGWISNSVQGVWIELEGPRARLEEFITRLEAEKPPHSSIQSLESSWLDPAGYATFEIRHSTTEGVKTALVLPDIATCPDCLREIFDPANRRYRYPFTNCTNCGPRFSIIEALPYDRANTSMKIFGMCAACQAEYDDPHDRRFHAQPNACPACGPHIELWDATGAQIACRDDALVRAAEAIRVGQIVAVKGLGGFHLVVDARNDAAVRRLRARKRREEKPFALMFPSMASVKAVCEVSPAEERLLRAPEAPIVLLRRKPAAGAHIAESVAPGNPNLGVMLPYTPLHHLLMAELGFPVVATSGNLSDEPICTDEHEALNRLGGIADMFLVHNRPIVRHVDDSIVRIVHGRELVLRRARGYAPLPVPIRARDATAAVVPVLAVGAHLKNTVALAVERHAFISQHIGDLDTAQAHAAFQRVVTDLQKLYEREPRVVAVDMHPDYMSTKFALQAYAPESDIHAQPHGAPGTSPRIVSVQHHVAHVLACMAENELEPPALGVAWDGTGFGWDGAVWGGEFFVIEPGGIRRIAHLRQFRLPGGDKAVLEPRRAALGLLFELAWPDEQKWLRLRQRIEHAFKPAELDLLDSMLRRRLNAPACSSVGRLFDAVAALLGLCHFNRFEGQAAMTLEFALEGVATTQYYPIQIKPVRGFRPGAVGQTSPQFVLDWAPMIEMLLADAERGIGAPEISARFHNTLAEAIVTLAHRAGQQRVVLSGGCFQNRYLTERTIQLLETDGFKPYWHQRVPPNDGGIALGQAYAALHGFGIEHTRP